MLRSIRFQALTRVERHAATGAIQETVSACGGWILSSQPFSNAALNVSFEMQGERMPELVEQLNAAGIVVETRGHEALLASPPRREIPASLFVQFIHGEPDLKVEVPPVPG